MIGPIKSAQRLLQLVIRAARASGSAWMPERLAEISHRALVWPGDELWRGGGFRRSGGGGCAFAGGGPPPPTRNPRLCDGVDPFFFHGWYFFYFFSGWFPIHWSF